MYCKLVFSEQLCEIDFDLPEPVKRNESTGRAAKYELEVIIIVKVTLTVIVNHRRKTSLFGSYPKWHHCKKIRVKSLL